MTTFEQVVAAARAASPEAPLDLVVSPCLLGDPVGFDGSAWPSDPVRTLCALPNVRAHRHCAEDFGLGTPREYMQIHGGDGHDVLDGGAQVIQLSGRDVTAEFRAGADAMVALAARTGARLGVLTDVSPSCGVNVIHRGEVPERAYRSGPGVTAAALLRAGVCVISQRDHASLERLLGALAPGHVPDPDAFDFVRDPWYRDYFGSGDGHR